MFARFRRCGIICFIFEFLRLLLFAYNVCHTYLHIYAVQYYTEHISIAIRWQKIVGEQTSILGEFVCRMQWNIHLLISNIGAKDGHRLYGFMRINIQSISILQEYTYILISGSIASNYIVAQHAFWTRYNRNWMNYWHRSHNIHRHFLSKFHMYVIWVSSSKRKVCRSFCCQTEQEHTELFGLLHSTYQRTLWAIPYATDDAMCITATTKTTHHEQRKVDGKSAAAITINVPKSL